jgi:cellulase/cellobiase CelA1
MPHTLRAIDGEDETTAGHLAAYAELAPATRSSGSSIRGEQPSRRGNKQPKGVFFPSAFATLGGPAFRAHYDKKIAQGKYHTQALLCSASPDAGPTSSSRCSATAPSTNPGQLPQRIGRGLEAVSVMELRTPRTQPHRGHLVQPQRSVPHGSTATIPSEPTSSRTLRITHQRNSATPTASPVHRPAVRAVSAAGGETHPAQPKSPFAPTTAGIA